MDLLNIVRLAGGLALFLFGMNVMGDALAKLAGGKLEKILEKLTSKRIYAILLGTLVTAVIQSSSATTVMVVGFVNSGIMSLNQAVGIIIGANIGTTMTSWILSLVGLQGDSLLLSLLKPVSLSSLCALAGILLYMSKKDLKKKDIGMIFLGFAVLMFGMQMMSDSVAPLANEPGFTRILTMFSNPLLGVTAGAVLTAVIQSSSASVGILQALAATGAMTYATVFPIVMGQNIGTCVTAVLSSVGASVNARRASMIHFFFNFIGTLIFLALFYIAHGIVDFAFIEETATAAGIATIHSIFNVACCLMLAPFASLLVKLATLAVRDHGEAVEENATVLDDRFLEKPSFAMELCSKEMFNMCGEAVDSCFLAIDLLNRYDEDHYKEIISSEKRVDEYEDEIGSYLLKLSGKELSDSDNKRLSLMLYTLSDFERISDHSLNIAQTITLLKEKGITLSEGALKEMSVLSEALREITNRTLTIYVENRIKEGNEIEPIEEVIDELTRQIKENHIERLRRGECSGETGMLFEDIVTDMERISDHCSNIALSLVEIEQGAHDSHSTQHRMRKEDNDAFRRLYEEAKQRYSLQ